MLKAIMAGRGNERRHSPAKYETVSVAELGKTRRGKHHDFVSGVMADLEVLKEGSALKIPLKDVNGVSVVKLRAALNRASAANGRRISTSSDRDHLYVWRQGR